MAGKVTRGVFAVRKPTGITSAALTNKLREVLQPEEASDGELT